MSDPNFLLQPARDPLGLHCSERTALWRRLNDVVENYFSTLPDLSVRASSWNESVDALLNDCDLTEPMDPQQALDLAVKGLYGHQVHAAHPRHFGLFVPRPTTMGIVAETLVAAFNPQAGSRQHSPFAVEVEAHLLRTFAEWFGFDPEETNGTFTNGGAEANHTAVLAALDRHCAGFARDGVWALRKRPSLYLSEEGHRSFHKVARVCGLGAETVRLVPTDAAGRMDVQALLRLIDRDRRSGWEPLMIVATAGTTAAGAVDPISALADVAACERLWLHVDGAWGAAAAWLPELAPLFQGLARADSMTFDPHKWLSVPMGASTFLTRHPGVLERLFSVDAPYLSATDSRREVEPYARSLQWSRRFAGLKVFLSLLVAGRRGYRQAMRRQLALGDVLRTELMKSGWTLRNRAVLPVVCFDDIDGDSRAALQEVQAMADRTVATGEAWICAVRTRGRPVLRACISGYGTTEQDVLALVETLARVRASYRGTRAPPVFESTHAG